MIFIKNINNRIMMVFILIFLGVLVSIQLKSTLTTKYYTPTDLDKQQKIEKQLIYEKAYTKKLKQMIDLNDKLLLKYLKVKNGGTDYDIKIRELERLYLVNGMTNVTGNGVVINLNDAAQIGDGGSVSEYIVHDKDINMIVNDLRNAGAQAISINNERIISMSELVCAGPTVKINKNRYAVPFEIKAIGEPSKLVDALNNSPKVIEMRSFSIRVDITTQDNLKIPKYRNNIDGLISGLEVKK